jgi:hypothetical protein
MKQKRHPRAPQNDCTSSAASTSSIMGVEFGKPPLLLDQAGFQPGRLVAQGESGQAGQLADALNRVGSAHLFVAQRLHHRRGGLPLRNALV